MQSLMNLKQWVCYRLEPQPGKDKMTKIPYDPGTGWAASTVDPNTWQTYDVAFNAWQAGHYSGIGFVFTENDPYFFFDLDGCVDLETGAMEPEASGLMHAFPGAAWEYSQSGEGIHIVGRCDVAALGNRRNRWNGWLEFYTSQRFMALGRNGINGWNDPAGIDLDWTPQLQLVVPVREADNPNEQISGDGPRKDWNGPSDDDELIERMMKSSPIKALTGQVRFKDLWEADAQILGSEYPDAVRHFDHSAADLGLMNHLSFWTGCDWDRMIRLFGMSKLADRDKWRKRVYYRNHTTRRAIKGRKDVYNGSAMDRRKRQIKEAQEIGDEEIDKEKQFAPILSLDEMLDRFWLILQGSKDGVGVIDKEINKPISLTAARTYYAASMELVPSGKIDKETGQEIMKPVPAIDLWVKSPLRKSVDVAAWNPAAGLITQAPEHLGLAFNMWSGLLEPKFSEYFLDPSHLDEREQFLQIWHNHLAYLVPEPDERKRFEQWLGHILQHPGRLPQTAYLMWTDQTGIGRNWLSAVLARVLRGYGAIGVKINVAVDDKSFNGRLSRKLIATVDEAKSGMADGARFQRAETLKSNINEEFREIKNKYGLEWTEHNCMRWLFFSNHADALPFDRTDRRIIVIENPNVRQSQEYYKQIYDALENVGFISAIFAHLIDLSLEGFEAGSHAPMNRAKETSLGEMESPITKALREFCSDVPNDQIYTVTAIKQILNNEYGITNIESLNPRVIGTTLKEAGILTFPKPIRMIGKLHYPTLVNSRELSISQFYDYQNKNYKIDAAKQIREIIESFSGNPHFSN